MIFFFVYSKDKGNVDEQRNISCVISSI
jgi:hypothetical protein